MLQTHKQIPTLFIFCVLFVVACSSPTNKEVYTNIRPKNAANTVNMIVEIPAGTTAKFEMNKDTYELEMDSINGKPRYIDYLPYPGNYGMIPNTLLTKEAGGDGDPLDIFMLGSTKERGSIQKVRVIGVLELLDNGEQDDKLIGIDPNSNWGKVQDIEDLDKYYPGSKEIVSTFFQNYKGKDQMELKGWSGKSKANIILSASIRQSLTEK